MFKASLGIGQHGENSSYSNAGGSGESFYFKLLCPQFVTGLIIGRGGSVLNQLNNTCGAKIKLSQNNEYYPSTNDRILVCKYFSVLAFTIFPKI